jgi:signal transduction histidine kinase/ActR/RegA family two-component response regulator
MSAKLWQARAIGPANRWLLRFLPKELPEGDDLRRGLVTAAVACLFLAIAPLYTLMGVVFENPPLAYHGLALLTLAGCASALVLLKKGRIKTACWLLMIVGTFATAYTALREGASGQAAGNMVLPIVMAALMLGWRGALAIGAPSLIFIATMSALEQRGLFHPQPLPHPLGVFAIIQVSAVMVMLVVFDNVRTGLVRAQRALEDQLVRSGRLEAIGRVAGGVAHDFNNLLTVILANASLLAESPAATPGDTSVDEIRAAAKRGAQLTKQLLAFSRRQKLEPRAFDLAALAAEERTLLSRLIPENIAIETSRPGGAVWVHADPGQISQVVLNLVVNARDAMPAGGRLYIGVSEGPTGFATLEVRDTGTGMDTPTLERAFEPFFTTKGAVGTGLGLATVHGIVTQSNGQVRVRSGDAGTTFEVLLPAATPPLHPARSGSSDEIPRGGRHSILLVEDDGAVRTATARVLQSLGHEVAAHADIASALAAWRATPDAFDLILSDVVMPGGGGPELLRELPSARDVRVMFMSGYTNDALKDPELACVPFIPKPFTERELARKLAEVLAGVAPRERPTPRN